ncbi:mannose/glucose-specific lectin-like [Phragmites australis]|uniref:mannose/glucose-specific lectin-like n=1 Tax=Phragmites australis TaxID=29695 RepID=UPI002D792C64|nr:mannose/glucose-specific lectin-like [Phragmites australis]XP_062201798.1 mannose/glucose-specific lectin-like [Phragmites australis]
MENNSQHASSTPTDITLRLLEDITHDFSEEHKVGSGGYGQVFKGVHNGVEIAVKKLHHMPGLDDVQFKNEFSNLMRVQHKNIVRLVGYCYEIRHKHFEQNGGYVFAQMVERALCFEYLEGGSLDKHLSDESCGLDWDTRYKIIKGISEGLDYLHNGSKYSIFHLDLKPANILLDKNMMPKIGDFGLSRLFASTTTYTTKNIIGTANYMPPEYITKRKISEKYDVFSLGVIIIDIMTGPLGHSKYADMPSQEFIELVNTNWRNRIQTTSLYPTGELYQVDTCIKIAIKCVGTERENRPTVAEIVHNLNETEIVGKAMKIGPWGGPGGVHHDLELEVLPQRLISVVVCSGKVIDSLAFTYSDCDGRQRTAGPWGESVPHDGSFHTILLGPSEFLKEVNGTIGRSPDYAADIVTSILFVTNAGRYGPFGGGGGTPFCSPMQGNGSIVGFFARTGVHVDAVGVYFNPERETVKEEDDGGTASAIGKLEGDIKEQNKAWISRIGPWGGQSGWRRDMDIKVVPQRLNSITIRSGDVVIALAFSYSDDYGKPHHAGIWGSYGPSLGGTFDTIQLGPSEFLTEISGTVGLCTKYHCNVVTSLKFITSARTYGPFGEGKGIPFHSPVLGNASIVGFFAHATGYVDAIGVYLNHERKAMKEKALITKIGPWGRNSWGYHDVEVLPRRLISVLVHSGKVINSLAFTYSDCDGQQRTAGSWGEGPRHDGSFHTIQFGLSEILKEVSGTVSEVINAVTSLLFVTNAGIYGPFGEGGGIPFRSPLQSNGSIVGFFADANEYVGGIGVYVG